MFLLNQDIFFWDLAIVLLMTFSFSGALACAVLAKRKHRKVTTLALSFLSLIGFVVFACITYGSFIEPQILVITKYSISHPLAPKMTIAVLSDPHVGPYKGERFVRRAVATVNSTLPDIVLLPGDFVYTLSADLKDLEPLKDIRSSGGVYAVMGNHDVGQLQTFFGKRLSGKDRGNNITAALEDLGIVVLRNTQEEIQMPDGSVSIAGIEDIWTGHADLSAALDPVSESSYSILISHNPSVIEESRALDAHLIVSGHTHGGQIQLPGIGPLAQLPISIDQKYYEGIFPVDADTTLAITRGIGESSPRSRFLAWPEILLLEVSPAL